MFRHTVEWSESIRGLPLLSNCSDAVYSSGSAWLGGNMAHQAGHIPLVFIVSVYSVTSLFLYMIVAFAEFETVCADSVFGASHTATVSTAVARDVR